MLLKHVKNLAFATSFLLAHGALAYEIDFKAQAKANYRDSDQNRFPTNFPPGSALETVDSGSHFEISNIALFLNVGLSEKWSVRSKVDVIDLYEKNPTSSDLDISLDSFIVQYGENQPFYNDLSSTNVYFRAGKFGKFERQEDRHLESYGLVSTAFNRVEDSGLEIGLDFQSGVFAKLSYTSGNPVFFRDPNALAGDNGVDEPEFNSGVVVLYDAEVETFNLTDTPEIGIGAGYRWMNEDASQRFRFLAFHYDRDLAETKELHGTFYGGDLDLFEFSELFTPGPIDPDNDDSTIPLENSEKSESGINVWWYADSLTLFAQFVQQDIGGLKRDGGEIEISYNIKLPNISWLNSIEPVVRYSVLNNDFATPVNNPSPSFAWDWEKTDIGINFHFSKTLFLTAEYAINRFQVRGDTRDNDEFLATLTWRYD